MIEPGPVSPARLPVGQARAALLCLGWLLLLTGCTPTPPAPPVQPAPVPEAPAPVPEPTSPQSVELIRKTLQTLAREHLVPIPVAELRSRFIWRLREQLSEGPWRVPLPGADKSLQQVLDEFQQHARGRPLLPAVEAALAQLVQELDDGSRYLDREQVQVLRGNGSEGGIGVNIRQGAKGVVISEVLAGSPAERAGLGRGDRLRAIDATPTADMLLEEVVARLQDTPGSQVTLNVEFANGEQRVLNLQREKVELIPVEGRWLSRGIAYIRVRTLSASSVDEFNRVFLDLLRKVGAPRGLVLDLRDNTGGLLEAVTRLADTFLSRGIIFQIHERADREVVKTLAQAGSEVFERKLPVTVLINDYTVSGAEAIAAALQDHRRAVVVGRSRSYGQGRVYTLLPLPGGRLLKLATGTLYRASGVKIEGRGVVPDLCVEQTAVRVVPRAEVAASTDRACPYREMSGSLQDDALLSVALELLADRPRFAGILERDAIASSPGE